MRGPSVDPLTPQPSSPEEGLEISPFEGDPSEWDNLVSKASGGTHFHRFGWRQVMVRSMRHSCLYLGARDTSGALVGLAPLVYVGSALFGRYVVSMPFLNYGGPIGTDTAVTALGRAALEEGGRRKARLVELRSAIPLSMDWQVSHRKITVALELPDDPDALFASFKAKLRSQIRRPEKEGIVVRFGLEHLEAFYQVFTRHMRDLGTPVLSRRFFQEIVEVFPASVRLAVAFREGKPIAGGFGFAWRDEIEITWASSLMEYKKAAPNMLVYWEFMRRSIGEGLRRFNFGRCTPGSGTHRFKLQWGGQDVPLHWYQHSRRGEDQTPSPDDPSFTWGPKIWRRLPLGVANTLGPRIVRLIP